MRVFVVGRSVVAVGESGFPRAANKETNRLAELTEHEDWLLDMVPIHQPTTPF